MFAVPRPSGCRFPACSPNGSDERGSWFDWERGLTLREPDLLRQRVWNKGEVVVGLAVPVVDTSHTFEVTNW